MVKFQKWFHLFNQPLKNLYTSKVIEFYTKREYYVGNNSTVYHVSGVKIYLDEKVLGEIVEIPTRKIISLTKKNVFNKVLGDCKQVRR